MKSLSDIELLALIASDPAIRQAAFAELYGRHSQRVYAYCLRHLNDRDWADDLFQETFIRFYNAAREGRDVRSAPAYLLTIARNLCLNAKRDRPDLVTDIDIPDSGDSEADRESAELAQLAIMALELLPADQKEALLLQVYGGLSYEEISEALGVPLTTVRNWLARGKRRLREVLAKRLEEYRG